MSVKDSTQKLGDISRVMSDGYHFIRVRLICENWEERANQGDEEAIQAMEMISAFHRLCITVETLR